MDARKVLLGSTVFGVGMVWGCEWAASSFGFGSLIYDFSVVGIVVASFACSLLPLDPAKKW